MSLKKQIIVEIILSIFCLICTGSLSYAWVTQNRQVTSNNHMVKIEPMGVTINTYEAYQYDGEINTVRKTTEGAILNMTPYDSIFTERNVNTPLLLVVRLRDIQKDSNVNLSVTLKCTPGHNFHVYNSDPNTDAEGNYTSNLVMFKATTADISGIDVIAETEVDSLEYGKFFDKVCDYFRKEVSNENSYSFLNKNTKQKDDYVIINIPNITPKPDHSVDLYLLVDYDVDLVEAQDITNFSNVSLIMGNQVNYTSDIDSIIFAYQ